MPAHPEHITASHALHRVSSFIQILHIARQCGGIAADIDYPLWLHPDDRVEQTLSQPLRGGSTTMTSA